MLRRTLVAAVLIANTLPAGAEPDKKGPKAFRRTMDRCLVVGPLPRRLRTVARKDPVDRLRVLGTWKTPKAGDTVEGTELAWSEVNANEKGVVQEKSLRPGYALWTVESDRERIALLEAKGHSAVFVNGIPRTGDVYQTGFVKLPVGLRKGSNELLFSCARGRVAAKLSDPPAPLFFIPQDATLPDLVAGEPMNGWGALPVVNATDRTWTNLVVKTRLVLEPEFKPLDEVRTTVRRLGPRSVLKIPVAVAGQVEKKGRAHLEIRLPAHDITAVIPVQVRRPEEPRIVTFRSRIDGSVQYYGLRPSSRPPNAAGKPALVLTLHGAGVEAIGQARAYSAKRWAHIVAPTNRRPFGFDWEDWGRKDALEVLELAQQTLRTDPQRVYLTGHSMGGHGTWHVGTTHPDRFAAIGPSAGWRSFWSYVGGPERKAGTDISGILHRCTLQDRPQIISRNLAPLGVYVLHGAKDNNVPATEAREMVKHLKAFHEDVRYHEEPGVGHWWDRSDEAGADCVDWGPMFEFFARRSLPPRPRYVDFTTVHVGVSDTCHWARILTQREPMAVARIRLRWDPHKKRVVGTTTNVHRLQLRRSALTFDGLTVLMDESKVDVPFAKKASPWITLERTEKVWKLVATPDERTPTKSGRTAGPFKEALQNRFVFLYGTAGTPDENAWAYARARYDAEQFWYRGNGAVEILPDTEAPRIANEGRNAILYGHREANRAWKVFVQERYGIDVHRGAVTIGGATLKRPDLACLFAVPAPKPGTMVGVVAGTGPVGQRLTDRMMTFISGAAFPDFLVVEPSMLQKGDGGVVVAGLFGWDWTMKTGVVAWRKK